ncbi:MAG: hypothetical protein ACNA71_01135 [Kiritimatiellia bacterium]
MADASIALGQAEDAVAAGDADASSGRALFAGNMEVFSSKGFAISKQLLVVGALVLVFLSVYDTFSEQPDPLPAVIQQEFDAVAARAVVPGTALSQTIDMFDDRRIFGPPPPASPDQVPPVVHGWRTAVRESWELKGISQNPGAEGDASLEAIVFDSRSQRLQFLRVGESIRISDADVVISRIHQDRIELRRGDEVLILD